MPQVKPDADRVGVSRQRAGSVYEGRDVDPIAGTVRQSQKD